VFTAASAWWWVPVVAPCVGAVVGALTYDVLVTRHHPPVVLGDTGPPPVSSTTPAPVAPSAASPEVA
jgi:hypothetical protein